MFVTDAVAAYLLLATQAEEQRGLAFGINGIAFLAGQFVGLVVGGILAAINWRLVFFVSVPVGLAGTIWAYMRLEELGTVTHAKIDWAGNLTFAVGLTALLIGITYGIQPYGGDTMGWTNPFVLGMIGGGLAMLVLFVWVERRVAEPLFDHFHNVMTDERRGLGWSRPDARFSSGRAEDDKAASRLPLRHV